jgi:hypothetical protein
VRPAIAMAAARATGVVALDPAMRGALSALADRTGRRVVDVDGLRTAIAWQEGYGPNLDEGVLTVYALPQTTLLALGLALSLCIEPHRRLPGRDSTINDFDAAVERLARRTARERPSGGTGTFIKGALVMLHEVGLVRVDGKTLSLGPALGTWGDTDWNAAQILASRLREDAP